MLYGSVRRMLMHFCWSIRRLFFFTLMSASSFSWFQDTAWLSIFTTAKETTNQPMFITELQQCVFPLVCESEGDWKKWPAAEEHFWRRIRWEVFYLVSLKILQRLTALDQLLLELLDRLLQLADLLGQLAVRSVVARLNLRPLVEETHERVAFSVPSFCEHVNTFQKFGGVPFLFLAKARKVCGSQGQGGIGGTPAVLT